MLSKQFITFKAICWAKTLELLEAPTWGLVNLINAILFIFVFRYIGDTQDPLYLQPLSLIIGLNLWTILHCQRAYEHVAYTMFYYKLEKVIDDYLASPMHPFIWLLTIYYDGLISALFTATPVIILILILGMPMPSLLAILYIYFLIVILIGAFSSIAIFSMFWADKWDHLARIDMILMTPLFLLSGTFFTKEAVLTEYQFLLDYNPIYLLLTNVKNAWFFNQFDFSILYIFLPITLICMIFGYYLLKIGWRVKQ